MKAIMANFRTHVTTSTVLGIGYSGLGIVGGIPADTALVAGGLCGVAGMLPDLDSPSGKPIREILTLGAAVVPLMLMDRFHAMNLPHDRMVLIGGAIYLFIRFGIAAMLKRWAVHRGIFHCIPGAILLAELAFLFCGGDLTGRYIKAGAILIGVFSHLILDEIYSVEMYYGVPRLKKSFGSAFKFWGDSVAGNISVYVKLIVATAAVLGEPMVMNQLGAPQNHHIYETANKLINRWRQ